jgi:hypothetical protein
MVKTNRPLPHRTVEFCNTIGGKADDICSLRDLPVLTDAVEKGIFRNLEATLIQDRKPTRNLDSKIQVAGFVRFKF